MHDHAGAGGLLSRFFRWHGKTVSRCPLLFIAAPILVLASFAAGLNRLIIDDDPNIIWVPPTSNTSLQEQYFNAAFDPFFRINQINILLDQSWSPSDDNATMSQRPFYSPTTSQDRIASGALTREYMMAALALQLSIVNANATDSSGNVWTLADLCYKPIQGEGCLIETPLDWFFSDPNALKGASAADIQNAAANNNLEAVKLLHPNYLPGWSSIHTPMMPSVILGGMDCLHANVTGFQPSVCGGCGTYAEALVITFLLQATEALTPAAQAWEQQVFLAMASNFSYPGLRVSYMAQRSLQDQINELGSQNKIVIVVSYCVMFAYITLALGKFPHPVFTRALLGLQGIMIVIISCVGAVGICAWWGLHITMIVTEVVPFLILALGVDNVFILTKAFDRHWWGPFRGRWDPLVGAEGLKRWHAKHTPPPPAAASVGGGNGHGHGNGLKASGMSVASSSVVDDPHNDEGSSDDMMLAGAVADDLASVLTSSSAAPFLSASSVGKARGASINQSFSSLHQAPERIDAASGNHSSGEPFLASGVEDGDDDTEPCYRGVYGHEGALSSALAEVGPTITSAAVCEMLAFGVGAATNIPALKQFCVVAAVAVFLDYALQMSWFAAAIAMDARRQERYRYDCVPCCRGKRPAAADAALAAAAPVSLDFLVDDDSSSSSKGKTGGYLPLTADGRPLTSSKLGTSSSSSSSSALPVAAIVASVATGPDATITGSSLRRQLYRGQYVRRFCRDYYSSFILWTPVRLVVLLAWAAMLGVSIYGAGQLSLGLPQQLALPQDSYLSTYFDDQSLYGDAGPPLYLVLQNVNYSHPDTPAAIEGIVEAVSSISRWIEPPVTSWVRQFTYWQSDSSRAFIFANVSSSGVHDCPLPLDPATTPLASQIAQFLWDIPIMSDCCQKAGYCSGQYGSDVKFLWGVPKGKTLQALRESWADTQARKEAGLLAQQALLEPSADTDIDGGMELLTEASDADVLAEVLITAGGDNFKPSSTHLSELYKAADGDKEVYARQLERFALQSKKPLLPPRSALPAGSKPLTMEQRLAAAPAHLQSRVRSAGTAALSSSNQQQQQQQQQEVEDSSNPVFVHPTTGETIDDGGCDLSFGYVPHQELASALPSSKYSGAIDASANVLRGLPAHRQQQLLKGVAASSQGQIELGLGLELGEAPLLPAITLIPCHVLTSRLRTQLTALHNQSDYVGSLNHVKAAVQRIQDFFPLPPVDLSVFGLSQAQVAADSAGSQDGVFVNAYNFTSDNEHTTWITDAPGGSIFPYSLTFVYYEQYQYIRGVALNNVFLTIGVVFIAGYIVTSSLAVAGLTAFMVLCITIDVVGLVWLMNPGGGNFSGEIPSDPFGLGPYGVDINAVSVVNLVAAVGLAVEFGVHIISYFSYATGTRLQRVRAALTEMGSSVFTGITLTKLVGVSVLASAPSKLFVLYYFRMYISIVISGFFHGLMVLPVFLSFLGWPSFTSSSAAAEPQTAATESGGEDKRRQTSVGAKMEVKYAPSALDTAAAMRKASSASSSMPPPAVNTTMALMPQPVSSNPASNAITPTASATVDSLGSGARFVAAGSGSGGASGGSPSAYASS